METSAIVSISFKNAREAGGVKYHNYKVKTADHEGETYFTGEEHTAPIPGDVVTYDVTVDEKYGLKLKKMTVIQSAPPSAQTDLTTALDDAEKKEEENRLPMDNSEVNYQVKLSSLDLAVRHHGGSLGADYVIKTAKQFQAYLTQG